MTVCGVMMLWSLTQLKGWILFVWNDSLSVFKGIKLNFSISFVMIIKEKYWKSIDIQKSIFVMHQGCFTFFCYICLSVSSVSLTWHLCLAFRVNQSSHLLTQLCSLSRLSSSSLTRLSHQDLSLATNFQLYPSIDSTAHTLCFFFSSSSWHFLSEFTAASTSVQARIFISAFRCAILYPLHHSPLCLLLLPYPLSVFLSLCLSPFTLHYMALSLALIWYASDLSRTVSALIVSFNSIMFRWYEKKAHVAKVT